ncbi:DUF938 domain-containing protein [Brevundimonas sp.]|uniref:DUF938 domain-containing protein n=1 Tax=Brevundimonas sp. TaxID=1871086 RepID=UPI002FC5D76B
MQTMDTQQTTPAGGLFSPAAARNSEAILGLLATHLPAHGHVLEIASGSGQHALAAAHALHDIVWQASDPSPEALQSIEAWRNDNPLPNLPAPLRVDMTGPDTWPDQTYDALVCINMIHISPWEATEGLMALAGKVLPLGGLLYLYGPYRELDVPLAPSNAAFDESLKARNPAWGLRDSRDVSREAKKHGLRFTRRVEMAANNISLIYRRF